jgi:hypothetical protein
VVFIQPWEDLCFSRVNVCGIIIGCSRIGESGYQFILDDGTGRINCIQWTTEKDENIVNPERFHNKLVSVSGQLHGFRSSIQVKAESIELLATSEEPTEETLWWTEVMEEWESLAACSRTRTVGTNISEVCPCLCHASTSSCCRLLGLPGDRPGAFNRAVGVLSTAFKTLAISSQKPRINLTYRKILELVDTNKAISSSLQAIDCFAFCATRESVRQLMKTGWISQNDRDSFSIHPPTSRPVANQTTSSPEEPRYPLTPFESQCSQLLPFKEHSVPKFRSSGSS